MKRSEALRRLAIMLAVQNGKAWQAHPTPQQYRVQSGYEQRAAQALTFIEGKMLNYQWSPES